MSNTILFLVSLNSGSYEDSVVKPVRVYTDRKDADKFCAFKNAEADCLEGKFEARDLLMADWEKSHPRPEQDRYYSTEYEAWASKLSDERGRLHDVLFGQEGVYCRDEIERYYVTEVPLDVDPYSKD